MRVWVTRAQPAAEATARRLRDLGHEPVIAPLIQTRPLVSARLDLDGVGALAFTSANGVAAFAVLTPVRRLPVYAVGQATAAAAREAGLAKVTAGDADVAALARLIAADPNRPAGAVLFAGALEPAGDLVGDLTAAGVEARAAAVYATEPVAALPDLGQPAPCLALIHSPKAAQTLAGLALPEGFAEDLRVLALSPACAAPLAGKGFAGLEAAAAPHEAALLALLPPA